MRIGILTQYYPPEIGAPQNRLSDLAARLVAHGHEVYVLTGMPNYPLGRIYPGYGGWYRREVKDGVVIVRTAVYPTKRVDLWPRLFSYFSFVLTSLCVGTFRLPRLDFLLTESPPLFLGISGYLLSRLKRARFIFNVSDLWPESAVRMGFVKQGLWLKLAWKLERFCYRRAWIVSGQSREILSNISARFPDVSLHYMSNGVDVGLFRPELNSVRLHEELAGGRFLALYAGLHGAAQGLDQLLQAADQLRNVKEITILLVGDGPEKEALQERARAMRLDNVHFLPPFPRDKMPSLIASADLALVLLKRHLPGAVPSKIYEAMGSGVPVLLAAEGEAAEIIAETGCGLVVRPGDSKAIAAGLLEMARAPQKRKEMGRLGRTAALVRFDRQRICQSFIELMEQALEQNETDAGDPEKPSKKRGGAEAGNATAAQPAETLGKSISA